MPAIETLRVAGPPGRKLAARLDLIRSAGMRHAVRRRHDQVRLDALEAARERLYEELWRKAGRELGAECVRLGYSLLELRLHGRRTRTWQQWTALDDPVTLRLALDKEIVSELLADADVPVPEGREFDWRDLEPASRYLTAAPRPVVVKPASGTGGGVGTTTGIRRPEQLRRAFLRAARSGDRVRVERQVEGTLYRLLFLDGELLDTLRRVPPRLSGEGRSTVDELIAAENERRVAAQGPLGLDLLTVDLDAVFELERSGLSLHSVPDEGAVFTVKNVTNENRPADNETIHEGLADEVVADARRAVEAVGLRLAGVDVLTSDPAQPLQAAGGVVLEVNGTPGLHHHALVAEPDRATPVFVPVLRALLG